MRASSRHRASAVCDDSRGSQVSEPHPIYFRHGRPPAGSPSLEGGIPHFYMFRLSHVGLCAGIILLATFALLLVCAILFPVLLNPTHPQVRIRGRKVTGRGGQEDEFADATRIATSAGSTTSSVPPECVEKPCLPESLYFKAKPQGLFSWQVPPCSDFYSFVCTEDLLNRTHPQWLPYKHASVSYLYRSALRYIQEDAKNIRTMDTALAEVTTFVHNCSSTQTAARTRESFLFALETLGLGGFPFTHEHGNRSWRLDEVVALSLRHLDVAPFLHVQLPDAHAEYQEVLLTRHSPFVPRLELYESSKQLDRLISTWWTLRTLMPSLRQQTMTDVEATLSIFKDIGRASASTEVVTRQPVRAVVKHLPPIHHWDWEIFLHTVMRGARIFDQNSTVMVENMRYLREMAVLIGQYEPWHVLNFMALCVADELSVFFPERHARSTNTARLPYRDRSLPTKPQLCLRFAERTCPIGVEALLLQAIAGTNVREDLVREFAWWIPEFRDTLASYAKRLSWLGSKTASELESVINGLKVEIMFSDALLGIGEDLTEVECGYDRNLYRHHPMHQYTEAYKARLDKYYLSGNSTPSFRKYPPASSFEYSIVYDEYSNVIFIPLSYFGLAFQATPLLRKFYVVKILPDLVRTTARILANAQDPNRTAMFNAKRHCALGAYIAHPIPILFERMEGMNHWMYEDIMADHLALAPYLQLFLNLSQSAATDPYLVARGFAPYVAEHVAFFFYAESSCEPYTNHAGKPRSAALPSQTRINGALSQYAPFAVSFFCPYGSALAKEPCELYRRNTRATDL
ncbi:uncharacterized protein [Dermacentor albipictus]|uniref:uncharacterized protein isoform X2 n=1 Tax=Dermacentor albipictus TaxID=60249 RepID=UPI0038FC39E4